MKGKILVIDDEELVCKSLSNLLKAHGYEVNSSLDAREGLSLVEKEDYDVILLDLVIPEIDGLSVLKRIKGIDEQAVVIIITGYPTVSSIEEATKRGAFDYVVKPIDISKMTALIEKAVSHRRIHKLDDNPEDRKEG